MTFAITPVAAKDGAGTTIAGGVNFIDVSGTGAGPWEITKVTIDPAGVNTQAVLSNSAAKCDLSSVAGVTTVTGHGTASGAIRVELPTDSTGVLAVTDNAGSLTVDNGGTFAVQAAQSGTWNVTNVSGTVSLPTGASTAAKQPALGTAGSASTDVITVQGVASMTKLLVTPDSVALPANQSVNVAQINATTPLMGNGTTGTGSPRVTIASDNTAFSVNAVQSGIWTVQPGNTANTTAWKVDGSAVTQPVSGTVTANAGTGTLAVSLASVPSHAVTNAGTFAVQAACAGDVASAASDSGNPVKMGAVGKIANPTAVTDGQRVNLISDKLGKLITVGAIRDLKGVTQTQISNSTSETTIVAAVASTFMDVYGLVFANTGATTTKVTVKDSTAGTTRMIFEVPTLETRGFMVPVDSAVPQATVNNNWTATCASATTAMEVTAFWVKNT